MLSRQLLYQKDTRLIVDYYSYCNDDLEIIITSGSCVKLDILCISSGTSIGRSKHIELETEYVWHPRVPNPAPVQLLGHELDILGAKCNESTVNNAKKKFRFIIGI